MKPKLSSTTIRRQPNNGAEKVKIKIKVKPAEQPKRDGFSRRASKRLSV